MSRTLLVLQGPQARDFFTHSLQTSPGSKVNGSRSTRSITEASDRLVLTVAAPAMNDASSSAPGDRRSSGRSTRFVECRLHTGAPRMSTDEADHAGRRRLVSQNREVGHGPN